MLDRDNQKKQTIADLVKDIQSALPSAKPPRKRKPPASKASVQVNNPLVEHQQGVIYVAGNGNVVAGGHVTQHITHIYSSKPARPRVSVKTADGVIDAPQKAALTRLRDEWMSSHNAIKKSGLTYQAAWAKFNSAMKVNSYAELKPEQFEAGCKWFRQQIAMLSSMPSAPRKDGGHHNRRIGAIKARCKNELGDAFAYVAYIIKSFDKSSLADLDVKELEATYRYIMGKKITRA